MRISRSHFLSRDEEHAAVVLEILCATPRPPRIPKPAPQPVPRRPLPPPASDQVTLTQYSRHRRSSLTGFRNKAAMPHPAVRFIAPAACVFVRPPAGEAAIGVIAPCASPPAATPDFGETFQFQGSSASVHRASLTHRALLYFQPLAPTYHKLPNHGSKMDLQEQVWWSKAKAKATGNAPATTRGCVFCYDTTATLGTTTTIARPRGAAVHPCPYHGAG